MIKMVAIEHFWGGYRILEKGVQDPCRGVRSNLSPEAKSVCYEV